MENEEDRNEIQIGDITINAAPKGTKFRTAYLPVSRVPELARVPKVKRIHPARKNKLYNDVAAQLVNITPQTRGDPANKGDGVIIGIIDSGIDPCHSMFKERIIYVWDQKFPKSAGWQGHAYGRVFSKNPTEEALKRGEFPLSEYNGDTDGHGTHVSGTAAGSHPQYSGIAPEAKIVVVQSTLKDDGIISGIDFIWWVADKLKLPAVINLSLGSQTGPHDGNSYLDQAVSQRISEGRLICAAAGNEGEQNLHASGDITNDKFFSLKVSTPPRISFGMSVWIVGKEIPFQFQFRFGDSVSPVYLSTDIQATTTFLVGDLQLKFTVNGNSRKHEVFQDLWIDGFNKRDAKELIVDIKVNSGNNISTSFHSWLYGEEIEFSPESATASHLIGPPGSSPKAITVAAIVSRVEWETDYDRQLVPGVIGQKASFSSPGPVLGNNPNKPDCAAPGSLIISALSSQADTPDDELIPKGETELVLMQGTSMATPVVTGLVALLLSKNPILSAEDAKNIIVQNNEHPWNAEIGRGLVSHP